MLVFQFWDLRISPVGPTTTPLSLPTMFRGLALFQCARQSRALRPLGGHSRGKLDFAVTEIIEDGCALSLGILRYCRLLFSIRHDLISVVVGLRWCPVVLGPYINFFLQFSSGGQTVLSGSLSSLSCSLSRIADLSPQVWRFC